MDKFNLNPLSFLLLIAISSTIINQRVDALGSPSQGSHFSVTIDEDETSPVINLGIQGKDPKYRYSFDPSTEFANNPKRRRGRLPLVTNHRRGNPDEPQNVQVNPRGSSGFQLHGRGSSLESESNYAQWAQVDTANFINAVVVVPIDAGGRKVTRIQSVQPAVVADVNNEVQTINPPPHEEVAKMARFIVRNSIWTSMATISSRAPTVGFPFANIFSVSDGPADGNSTGIPYMYLTPLEISVIDLKQNPRASLTMSLAQGDYCRLHEYDPEDPRCAHVILTGTIVKIDNSTREAIFARNALFTRHPEMHGWPKDHGWFFAKLSIENILVLDYFGGAKSVTPEEYFQVNISN